MAKLWRHSPLQKSPPKPLGTKLRPQLLHPRGQNSLDGARLYARRLLCRGAAPGAKAEEALPEFNVVCCKVEIGRTMMGAVLGLPSMVACAGVGMPAGWGGASGRARGRHMRIHRKGFDVAEGKWLKKVVVPTAVYAGLVVRL